MKSGGVNHNRNENIATPAAPMGTRPNSILPAEINPAATLPNPMPKTTAIKRGVRSDSIIPAALGSKKRRY